MPCKSAYHGPTLSLDIRKKALFEELLERICKRNLQKKYGLKSAEIISPIKSFLDFKNENPDFLSKEVETFKKHEELFEKILSEKSAYILVGNTIEKFKRLTRLDKEILTFLLHYLPLVITEFMKNVEEKKYSLGLSISKDEMGEIIYYGFENIKEVNYIFNGLFNETLKEDKFEVEIESPTTSFLLPQRPISRKEYSFWSLGDKLVNLGIGYWAFYLSSNGNVTIKFMIPGFIYESIKDFKEKLPKLDNLQEKLDKIKVQYEEEMRLEQQREKLRQIEELKSNKQKHRKVKEYIVRVYEK